MRVLPRPGGERAAAVLLTLGAGLVDAVGFLESGIFTANMTGNTVLVGIALGQGEWALALQRLGAVVLFFAGAMTGYVVRRATGNRASVPLLAETVLLVAIGLLSPSTAFTAHGVAFAMGVQATAMLTFGGVTLSTVVVTSTMARVAERAVQIVWREPAPPTPKAPLRAGRLWLATWIAYVGGAVCGVGLVRVGELSMLPAAALVLVAALLSRSSPRPAS